MWTALRLAWGLTKLTAILAFYGTPLEFLLDELKVDRLIVTGLQAHICILFTAHDAFLRRYGLWVPADCVASVGAELERQALQHMAAVTEANVAAYADQSTGTLAGRFTARASHAKTKGSKKVRR